MSIDSLPEKGTVVFPYLHQGSISSIKPEQTSTPQGSAIMEGCTRQDPFIGFEGKVTFYTFGSGEIIPPTWEQEWTRSEEDHLGRASGVNSSKPKEIMSSTTRIS